VSVGAPPEETVNGAGEALGDGGWLIDKGGRQYIPAEGRRGRINRQGDETVEQAKARDQQPRDRRPGSRKPKAPRKAPPPKSLDLRELEEVLAEGLKSPAMMCAAVGDEWAAMHFVTWGPQLARNLVRAAEHNPWLRKRLERAASGADMMLQLVTIVGVAGSFGMYMLPPMVHWFNLPVPDKAREMMNIPPRQDAPAPPTAPPTAPAPA